MIHAAHESMAGAREEGRREEAGGEGGKKGAAITLCLNEFETFSKGK